MRRLVLLAVLAVVLGSGGWAVAQAREPEAAYSTATATRGDVERTLDLSGTVTATGRRDLGFGTAGTVSTAPVSAGQRVRKGQVLARLDTTALDAEVTQAQATLARAKAQLASDEDAQSDAVTASASTPTDRGATQKPRASQQPTTPSKPDPALQQALAQLASQQQAVKAAQSAATEAISAAKAALAARSNACQAPAPDPQDESGEAEPSSACTEALAAAQDAQDTVAQKQDQLQSALDALSGTLTRAVSAASSTSQSGGTSDQGQGQNQAQGAPAASTDTIAPSSSSDGDSGSSGSSGGTVSAARLAQDQADIDTAEARLGEAKAARRFAILRAPYAGRLLQVDLAKGDQVSASDTPVVLVGEGVTTVTATVTNAQVPDVRRGQPVGVTPAGWATPLEGTVTDVGLLPNSSGAFPVTVTVESSKTVSEGSTASVSIVTSTAKDAVTVPTSAVATTGTRAVVQVLDGDTVTRTQVTVGVVGARRTSITQGLEAGATVVVGDLAAQVPSSDAGTPQRFRSGPVEGGGPVVQLGGR